MVRHLAALCLLSTATALSGCQSMGMFLPGSGAAKPCGSCGGAMFMPDPPPARSAQAQENRPPAPPSNQIASPPPAVGLGTPAVPTLGVLDLSGNDAKPDELQLVSGPVLPGQREEPKRPVNQLPSAPPMLGPEHPEKKEPPTTFVSQKKSPGVQPLVEALRCVLDDRPEEALRYVQAYDADTQDLLLRLLPTVGVFSRKKVSELSRDEAEKISEQFVAMQAVLRPRTELVIARACFCEWAKSYGMYKPLSADHAFLASTPQRPGELVQLYVELKNFFSDARQGYHETCLSSTVEIRDSKGTALWSHRFDDDKHPLRSRTALNDYFNNYSFTMPPLAPGTYTLTIAVADQTRPDQRRVASKSIEFRVTALQNRNF